jgi:hypothetical protein
LKIPILTLRESQIEASRFERGDPSRRGKGDEEDQFGKAVASQKGSFQLDAGIKGDFAFIIISNPLCLRPLTKIILR